MRTRSSRSIVVALGVIAAAAVLVATAMAVRSKPSAAPSESMSSMNSMSSMDSMHSMQTTASRTRLTRADLRVTLDRLFAQHAVLAMNATNAGVTGSKSFPAVAKALDDNSVALSRAIASFYGAKAGQKFLNGKFMWRDHIKFFVNYTVAKARHNKAGQNKAVANLRQYTVSFGNFLAGATKLPKAAVRNDLLGHVLELKNQLDDYAAHRYAKASADYDAAYEHMFMTGDLVAGAIAKQKHLK